MAENLTIARMGVTFDRLLVCRKHGAARRAARDEGLVWAVPDDAAMRRELAIEELVEPLRTRSPLTVGLAGQVMSSSQGVLVEGRAS